MKSGLLDMQRLATLEVALNVLTADYAAWIAEQRERVGADVVGYDTQYLNSIGLNVGGLLPQSAALLRSHADAPLQVVVDLGAQALLPGHAGRFSIAAHDWDEPFIGIAAASR